VATMLGQIFARIGARLSAVSRGKVRVWSAGCCVPEGAGGNLSVVVQSDASCT